MESIDRLREYVCDMTSVSSMTKANMSVYLDAIEQEVEQLRDREYQNGREDAGDAVEFADRLCRASERREDVTLWGVDYMPLPVDADGVPIHVGDVLEWVDPDGEVEVVCMVDAVGVGCFFAWDAANCRYAQKCANAYRHHHAPTVEDVLREFAEGLGVPVADSYIAATAAKLRLAGDE